MLVLAGVMLQLDMLQLDMLQLDMLHLRQFPCENTVTVLLLMDQMITVKKTGQKL